MQLQAAGAATLGVTGKDALASSRWNRHNHIDCLVLVEQAILPVAEFKAKLSPAELLDFWLEGGEVLNAVSLQVKLQTHIDHLQEFHTDFSLPVLKVVKA